MREFKFWPRRESFVIEQKLIFKSEIEEPLVTNDDKTGHSFYKILNAASTLMQLECLCQIVELSASSKFLMQ